MASEKFYFLFPQISSPSQRDENKNSYRTHKYNLFLKKMSNRVIINRLEMVRPRSFFLCIKPYIHLNVCENGNGNRNIIIIIIIIYDDDDNDENK